MKRDAATERQVQAAHPGVSTWLSANAGSGKTRVLTDRVARLLLSGTKPQHILCLTYTKAAAGEMQNRLFERLGSWAMLPDQQLREALAEMGADGSLSESGLRHARTLFASAIETPGGLKIQTIHGFCAALLRRFPLEAGVSPLFSEMEDRAGLLLAEEILDELATGPDRHVVDDVTRLANDMTLPEVTKLLVSNRAFFEPAKDIHALNRSLGLPATYDAATLERDVFLGDEAALLTRVAAALRQSGKMDASAAAKLAEIGSPGLASLPVLESVFLFASGEKANTAKIGNFPSKRGKPLIGDLVDPLEDLMRRVEAARPFRLALAAARKSEVLHRFAALFLPLLAQRKAARGWLDFDDLIEKARDLLRNPDVAEWVLFRLDGGIDHILVDEAQDTGPEQWEVIESLVREFTSGEGARPGVVRTLFVVGDKKQSIYSFQGADPDSFDRMQEEFGRRFSDADAGFQSLELEHSFRSSSAILGLVDTVFDSGGPSPLVSASKHVAFHQDMPGRVDLWPVVPPAEAAEDRHWTDPVDRQGKRHHTVILAGQIAASLKDMIDGGAVLPEGSGQRRVKPGDVLILLQRRTSGLFDEIIRACKALGLPIAGADRLRVGAELAVRDLVSLLKFLATPEDNLSLAEALRSPLLGWDEQALFDLAHRRTVPFLWQAMRTRGSEYPAEMALLNDLRSQTDFLRPYELLERILTRHDGRQRLLARLGPEAEDGIDALLSQAQAFEQVDVPSLTSFLTWLEADDLVIKRQTDSGGDLIRIMTVHGAKGLESRIVILPDTAIRRQPRDPEISVINGTPFWRVPVTEMPAAMQEDREARLAAAAAERARLLYVAMTRAEQWLIVAAAGKTGDPGDSWYSQIEAAMQRQNAVPEAFPGGTGLRLTHMAWPDGPGDPAPDKAAARDVLPDVFRRNAAPPPTPDAILSPSDLGGAKALPSEEGLDADEATQRGTHIHLLLEHLPRFDPADWPEVAGALLPEGNREDLLAEVSPLLSAADLAFLFGPDALAEVAVTGSIGERLVHGIIDRLIVTPKSVLAVDFKSNAAVPDSPETCPEGLLRQMGAYAMLLGDIYPEARIETAILWTRTGRLMRLPHALVTTAAMRAPVLDAAAVHS